MHPNEGLITRFYEAFSQRDHVTMGACYAPGATFGDPVFQGLDHDQTLAMWRMFCLRSTDLEVAASDIRASDEGASARWDAIYTFTPTGRRVHNVISASFDIEDGSITRHRDSFDLYRWTRMALGPTGIALGWTPLVQNKVRGTAMAQLRSFMQSEDPS